jgi:hypothetical protein
VAGNGGGCRGFSTRKDHRRADRVPTLAGSGSPGCSGRAACRYGQPRAIPERRREPGSSMRQRIDNVRIAALAGDDDVVSIRAHVLGTTVWRARSVDLRQSFNPRPVLEATLIRATRVALVKFQSAAPVLGATSCHRPRAARLGVSIRAPILGRPRSPLRRSDIDMVSIRAPGTGGDR